MLVLRSIAIGVLAAIALAVLSFGAASLFHLDAVGLYIAPANLFYHSWEAFSRPGGHTLWCQMVALQQVFS